MVKFKEESLLFQVSFFWLLVLLAYSTKWGRKASKVTENYILAERYNEIIYIL